MSARTHEVDAEPVNCSSARAEERSTLTRLTQISYPYPCAPCAEPGPLHVSKRRQRRLKKKVRTDPRRRKSQERQPAGETLQLGPLRLDLRGRFVEAANTATPEKHADFLAKIPQQREELERAIAVAVEEATELIRRCDPVALVALAFLKNCLVDPENYSEPEHEGQEAAVEYAQSLVMAVSEWGSTPPTPEQDERFQSLIEEILDKFRWLSFLRDTKRDGDLDLSATKLMGMMSHVFIRGSSMPGHEEDLIRAIYSPHDEALRARGLPTTHEILDFAADTKSLTESQFNKQLQGLRRLAALRDDFVQFVEENPEQDLDDAARRFRESARVKQAVEEFDESGARAPWKQFALEKQDKYKAVYEHLSLRAGDNGVFLEPAQYRAWPSNDTLIRAQPLIERDATVYCPSPTLLMRSRQHALERLIKCCGEGYYKNTFAKRRGKVAEELAMKHIAAALPGADCWSELYYKIGDQRFEADGLVRYQDYLFILEMKSAPLSTPALRGAPGSMKKEFGHLVEEPYRQALRTRDYIFSGSPAVFEDERGTLLVDLGKSPSFRRVYLVNVTLAEIGYVAARLNSMKAMDFAEKGWPWSVFVDDLRVISEIVNSPAEFLLYLDRRLRLNDLRATESLDELDYFGLFLREGLYFEDADTYANSRMIPLGYTVELERYYEGEAGVASPVDKPSLNTTPWYSDLARRLCASGAAFAATCLLSLKASEHEKIETWFRTYSRRAAESGESHTLTMGGAADLPLLVFVVARTRSEADLDKHEAYIQLKRFQLSAESAVLVFLPSGAQDEPWVRVFEGPATIPEADLENGTERFRRAKYEAHVAAHGKPGRNDPCPCNSGAKFKKCCLSRVPRWIA